MDHSYEELRSVALDLLAGREKGIWEASQYENLKKNISDALETRNRGQQTVNSSLSAHDSQWFPELFWDLFR